MSRKRYLSVSNFDALQHYKDRNPIWIKLHCSILDDYNFSALPDETKFHAVGLMLLASRLNNKFPDDEAWLRQKIGANSEINLKILLEIRFLEVIREEKPDAKNATNARKSNKTNGELASAILDDAENCDSAEQNRTEENRTEHNTTQQSENETRRAEADAKNVVVCDFGNSSKTYEENGNPKTVNKNGSMFSLADCLKYARQSENVKNPEGLANTLFKTGSADALIMAKLYPEEAAREQFGAPIKFTDEPCTACFGAKMSDVDGKGFRACLHCKNERGKSTGFEPKGELNNE